MLVLACARLRPSAVFGCFFWECNNGAMLPASISAPEGCLVGRGQMHDLFTFNLISRAHV